MCRMFSTQPAEKFECETRSIRLAGHATSIRLERAFWSILEEIAAAQGVSVAKFLTKLHDEVIECSEARHNFASVLRCACLTYVMEVRDRPAATLALKVEADRDFAPIAGGAPAH